MSQTVSIWILLLVALLAANLPFISPRVLAVWPVRRAKNLLVHLLELIVFYFLVGGLGLAFEHRAGQIAPQGWEFYAVTGALFATLAFPGFIWRYLYKPRH
jgi:hypothetical protein